MPAVWPWSQGLGAQRLPEGDTAQGHTAHGGEHVKSGSIGDHRQWRVGLRGATGSRDGAVCPRATAAPQLWEDEGPEPGVPHHCGPRCLPLPIARALDASLEDPLPRADEFVDILKAFVGMVGASVARMEEQVAKAEAELRTWPSISRRLLHTVHMPSFTRLAPEAPQTGYFETPSCSHRRPLPCRSARPGV